MKLLLVRLSVPIRPTILEEKDVDSLIKADLLTERDLDQSNGFYDYLRVDPQTIVGVRWCPFTNAEFVLDRVPSTPLITVESNGRSRSLNVWFGGRTEINGPLSDDQAFWYNRVLEKEDTGEVIVTFGLSNVSESEIGLLNERLATM